MNFVCFIFIVFLFVVLTPSNFVRLPQKGNKWVVSLVHGIIFAIILRFTYHYFMNLGNNIEGYKNNCTKVCGDAKQSRECNQVGNKKCV